MQEDGALLRDHLAVLARQDDAESKDRLENGPKLPPLAAHLWGHFCDMAQTRTVGMGPNRLTRAEIRQWEEDEGVTLDRWERKAIMAVDAAYLASIALNQKK